MTYNPESDVSPSQINKFLRCRFAWYTKYVLGLPDIPNFYLERGILVHQICERISNFVPDKSFTTMSKIIAFHMRNAKRDIEGKWPELMAQYKEADKASMKHTIEMIGNYLHILRGRALPNVRKYGAHRAWAYALPKCTEKKLSSEVYKLGGKIDSFVEKENMDGTKTSIIVDHKTSKFYETWHSDEYWRQLMMYALLWGENAAAPPDFVATEFLTSGETVVYPVRPSDLDTIKSVVKNARIDMIAAAGLSPHQVPRNVQPTCKMCERFKICKEDGYVK